MYLAQNVLRLGFPLRTGRFLLTRTWISTLAADRLLHTDLLDLSARKRPLITVEGDTGETVALTYFSFRDRTVATPFPENTRGYLYLHVPNPDHLAAAEVRFRLVPNGAVDPQAALANGKDLEIAENVPWRVLAVAACRAPRYKAFTKLSVRDKLLSSDTVQAWARSSHALPRAQTAVISHARQPFVCDLETQMLHVYAADGLQLHSVKVRSPLRDQRGGAGRSRAEYSGRVLCCFESGMSSGGTAVLHIRILKAISPIVATDPSYDCHLAVPKVGELLRRSDDRPLEFRPTRYSAALATLLRRDLATGYIPTTISRHKLRRAVSHLTPAELTCEDFIDLSGTSLPCIHILGKPFRAGYPDSEGRASKRTAPFPLRTHGFLYLVTEEHSQQIDKVPPRLAFRITPDSDPSSFAAGHDLLLPDGRLWTWTRKIGRGDPEQHRQEQAEDQL